MSEKLLRILLSELTTLRIACKCGAVIEMPVAQLDRQQYRLRGDVCCPGCGHTIRMAGPQATDAFDQLVHAWKALEALSGNLAIQFVLRDEEKIEVRP